MVAPQMNKVQLLNLITTINQSSGLRLKTYDSTPGELIIPGEGEDIIPGEDKIQIIEIIDTSDVNQTAPENDSMQIKPLPPRDNASRLYLRSNRRRTPGEIENEIQGEDEGPDEVELIDVEPLDIANDDVNLNHENQWPPVSDLGIRTHDDSNLGIRRHDSIKPIDLPPINIDGQPGQLGLWQPGQPGSGQPGQHGFGQPEQPGQEGVLDLVDPLHDAEDQFKSQLEGYGEANVLESDDEDSDVHGRQRAQSRQEGQLRMKIPGRIHFKINPQPHTRPLLEFKPRSSSELDDLQYGMETSGRINPYQYPADREVQYPANREVNSIIKTGNVNQSAPKNDSKLRIKPRIKIKGDDRHSRLNYTGRKRLCSDLDDLQHDMQTPGRSFNLSSEIQYPADRKVNSIVIPGENEAPAENDIKEFEIDDDVNHDQDPISDTFPDEDQQDSQHGPLFPDQAQQDSQHAPEIHDKNIDEINIEGPEIHEDQGVPQRELNQPSNFVDIGNENQRAPHSQQQLLMIGDKQRFAKFELLENSDLDREESERLDLENKQELENPSGLEKEWENPSGLESLLTQQKEQKFQFESLLERFEQEPESLSLENEQDLKLYLQLDSDLKQAKEQKEKSMADQFQKLDQLNPNIESEVTKNTINQSQENNGLHYVETKEPDALDILDAQIEESETKESETNEPGALNTRVEESEIKEPETKEPEALDPQVNQIPIRNAQDTQIEQISIQDNKTPSVLQKKENNGSSIFDPQISPSYYYNNMKLKFIRDHFAKPNSREEYQYDRKQRRIHAAKKH